YNSLLENNSFPEIKSYSYLDFLTDDIKYKNSESFKNSLVYWKEKLTPLPSPFDFSIKKYNLKQKSLHTEKVILNIHRMCYSSLLKVSEQIGVSTFQALLGVLFISLSKFWNRNDIIIGMPILNRSNKRFKNTAGLFMSMVPFRISFLNENSFIEILNKIKAETREIYRHQRAPIFETINQLRTDPNFLNELFDVTVVYRRMNFSQQFGECKLCSITDDAPYKSESLVLEIDEYNDDDDVNFHFIYNPSVISEDDVLQFAKCFEKIFFDLIFSPEKCIGKLDILNIEDYDKIVYQWNKTTKKFSRNKTLHLAFEEQVLKTPETTAVVFENEQLTYGQLNEKSNQLARYIRKQYELKTKSALTPDTLIALFLDRGPEMIIGILAVLKAGGAYVPMDPDYPQERIDYILEDTKTEIILTQKHLTNGNQKHLPEDKVIHIDLSEELYQEINVTNLPQQSQSTDLAYVIYTSGTTGKPKGVMLNHLGIVNRIEWMQSMYPLNADDVVLQKTPYVFDVSVWELLWANWYGAKIVFAKPEGHKDCEYLHQLINKEKVTTLHFVPSMLEAYNHYLNKQQEKFNITIRQIFSSGEALNINVVQQTYKNIINPSLKLHNLYGPTEASIDVTFYETDPNKSVNIGCPIQNTQAYILDPTNNIPVPIGVIGELHIGGAGLARGYLNLPDLTTERFVPNPFATQKDKAEGYTRLYKTGDLVRWLPDGNIEYIGRNDDQIKIRGFRIELGEIEHALSQIQGIKQCTILAKERANDSGTTKFLVAYYVPYTLGSLSHDEILNELALLLPEYMVPSILMEIEEFPLTINGKLNKKALPEADFSSSQSDYTPPENQTQQQICNIWKEELGIEKVGITDDFFRIGGNSILAIKVVHRMSDVLGFDCIVADIFKYPNIKQFLLNFVSLQISDESVEFEF
ncbi:MAG: amino acid adenylation domain-containing protein, partial [Prolixibacteraceae bacterium]|nr:amino acid adenylation domain-containing protein [Prolixibacteraceae bacterium]